MDLGQPFALSLRWRRSMVERRRPGPQPAAQAAPRPRRGAREAAERGFARFAWNQAKEILASSVGLLSRYTLGSALSWMRWMRGCGSAGTTLASDARGRAGALLVTAFTLAICCTTRGPELGELTAAWGGAPQIGEPPARAPRCTGPASLGPPLCPPFSCLSRLASLADEVRKEREELKNGGVKRNPPPDKRVVALAAAKRRVVSVGVCWTRNEYHTTRSRPAATATSPTRWRPGRPCGRRRSRSRPSTLRSRRACSRTPRGNSARRHGGLAPMRLPQGPGLTGPLRRDHRAGALRGPPRAHKLREAGAGPPVIRFDDVWVKFRSRLMRMRNLARVPFGVTLAVDDDTVFCPTDDLETKLRALATRDRSLRS